MKKAFITGIFGQDGYYLSKFLLEKGYLVFGLCPRDSIPESPTGHLKETTIIEGSVSDAKLVTAAIEEVMPDEFYNFAAPSFVPASWDNPTATIDIIGLGILNILEAIRKIKPDTRLYQASSSELFGNPAVSPQNEMTPFRPTNPYAASKLYAHLMVGMYRERYRIPGCCGIVYNHESPIRPPIFITRKVTREVAKIKLGLSDSLRLGNLDAKRDWGCAQDYVEAMWLMLQHPEPDDYVIGTGVPHSVRDLVEICFAHVDLDWKDYVIVDPALYRPAEDKSLVADPEKARRKLAWEPKITFEEMLHRMLENDMAMLREKSNILEKNSL